MNRTKIVFFIVALMALNGCSLYNALFNREPESPIQQTEYTLYWNAEVVGESELTVDKSNSSTQATVKENISYDEQTYTFIFELDQSLKSISVYHHNNFSEGYMQGNSYKISVTEDAVRRLPVDRYGNIIKDETTVTDSTKVGYTKNLFRDITQRLLNYYGYYIFESKNIEQFERIESQGYYLLNHRKL